MQEVTTYNEIAAMFVDELFPDELLDELTIRLLCNPNPHATELGGCLLEKRPLTRDQRTQLVKKYELEWTHDLKWDKQTQTMTIEPW